MNKQELLQNHFETQVEVDAPPAEVFDLLDDHRRLSAHMTKPSWMMAGSHMTIDIDKQQGHAIGSKITLNGKMLGMHGIEFFLKFREYSKSPVISC